MSTMTKAERDGSMSISLRFPLHGILYGVVTGARSDRVRSQRLPFLIQLLSFVSFIFFYIAICKDTRTSCSNSQ